MVEAGGVIERRRHEHDIVGRELQLFGERSFREQQVVVREKDGFRVARRTRRSEDEGGVVGCRALRLLFERLVAFQDALDEGKGGDGRPVAIEYSDAFKRGDVCFDGLDLGVETASSRERRADERGAFHLVEHVAQVSFVECARQRVHDGPSLQACDVHDAELRPYGHLEADHVALFDADVLQPGSQARRRVVHVGVGVAVAAVVHDVLAVGAGPGLPVPNVVERLFRPIPLLLVQPLALFVDLQVRYHSRLLAIAQPVVLGWARSRAPENELRCEKAGRASQLVRPSCRPLMRRWTCFRELRPPPRRRRSARRCSRAPS